MQHSNLLAVHNWRFACKEFIPDKKINDEDLKCLLEVIRLSPTSFGLQPFEVFVLNNQAILAELLPFTWGGQKQFPTASHVLMFVIRKDIRYDEKHIKHMLTQVQQHSHDMLETRYKVIANFQQNDFKLLENPRHLFDWAGKQAYIALGNVMTAAAHLQIDSCPIEGFINEEVTNVLTKHQIIDSSYQQVLVFCALGYRLNPPSREKTRREINDLIKFIS